MEEEERVFICGCPECVFVGGCLCARVGICTHEKQRICLSV